MIVRPTRQHSQIKIDMRLIHGKYSVNTLMTNDFFLIDKGFLCVFFMSVFCALNDMVFISNANAAGVTCHIISIANQ